MSLDTEKVHRLNGKSFDELYTKHQGKWQEMIEKAREYAQSCVGKGEQIRIGDVISVVQHAIKIDPMFEKHMKGKGLTQKYWVTWFAEYLMDSIYPQRVPTKTTAAKPSK